MSIKTLESKIYVACLASYNNGKLHGKWIDATLSGDEIQEEVNTMLALSTEIHAEEWAIHDYQDFEGINIDEWQSFDEVSEIANMLIDARWDSKLIAGVYEHLGSGTTPQDTLDYLNEHYQGEFDNLEDWAYQFIEDTGELSSLDKHLRHYFDYNSYARDMELNGDIFTISTTQGLHIFWNR